MQQARLSSKELALAEKLSTLRGNLLAWELGVRTITTDLLWADFHAIENSGLGPLDKQEMQKISEKIGIIEAQEARLSSNKKVDVHAHNEASILPTESTAIDPTDLQWQADKQFLPDKGTLWSYFCGC